MIDVYYRLKVSDELQLHHISFDVTTKEEAEKLFYKQFGPEYIITRYRNPVDGPLSCYKSALERYKKKHNNITELNYFRNALIKSFGYTEERLAELEQEWFPPKNRGRK